MGNVQTYILWETTKAFEYKEKKIESNNKALPLWMEKNGIPTEVMTKAMKIITEKKVVEENYDADVDLDFVFNALAENKDIRNDLRRHLCQSALHRVSIHHNYLELILEHLEPVVYKENWLVVRAGKLVDRMLIITEGVIVCDHTQANDAPVVSSSVKTPKLRFEKGEVYGEELLNIDGATKSQQNVRCEKKVEAFALRRKGSEWDRFCSKLRNMYHKSAVPSDGSNDLERVKEAYKELTTTRSVKLQERQKKIIEWLSSIPVDLQTLVMEHITANNVLEKNWDDEVDVKYLFSIGLSWDIEYHIKKQICIDSLRKIRVLEDVNEDVLMRICMSLEPLVLPQDSCIFYPLSPIDQMLIVVEGEITVTETTYVEGSTETKRGDVERRIKKSDVIGEELLTWAFPNASESSNSNPAILEKYVDCTTKVEAFALTKEGLESVVDYYKKGINKFEQLEKGRDGAADTEGASRFTTTVEQRLGRLIQLQSDRVQQLCDEMANQERRLDEKMAAFLSTLGYPAGTSPPPVA